MSDYTKLPRDIADCMSRAGSPLSEDQKLLLAGYLAPVQQKLADCEARVAELVLDAMRYRFIRDNQCWQRTEPYYDEPGYDLIGVKFERDNGFTAKAYLDFAIDKRLRQQADEAERSGGEK